MLKTAPRGVSKDHPRIDLLRHKGLVMSRSWPVGAWLGTRKAKERVVATLEAARPLNGWLDQTKDAPRGDLGAPDLMLPEPATD
ncbi:MAG: hypothetical protein JWN67_4496 [Actinomycetia bacterium]|nr:hypothetical protein [Actinomycetes bacterium]